MTETHQSGCLEANMLAEYIDGGLEPRERAKVEEHLAECGECYENFAETVHAASAVAPAAVPAKRAAFSTHRWAAVAAILVAVVGGSTWPIVRTRLAVRSGLAELVSAVGQDRFSEARLAEPFAWGPKPSVLRGGPADTQRTRAQSAADTLARHLEQGRNARTLYAAGVAELSRGQLSIAAGAFRESLAGGWQEDAAVGLAATLLEQARRSGGSAELDEALRVLDQDGPQTSASSAYRFNRALTLERLGRAREAIDEWRRYVAIEQDPLWRAEGDAHIARLGSPGGDR